MYVVTKVHKNRAEAKYWVCRLATREWDRLQKSSFECCICLCIL